MARGEAMEFVDKWDGVTVRFRRCSVSSQLYADEKGTESSRGNWGDISPWFRVAGKTVCLDDCHSPKEERRIEGHIIHGLVTIDEHDYAIHIVDSQKSVIVYEIIKEVKDDEEET